MCLLATLNPLKYSLPSLLKIRDYVRIDLLKPNVHYIFLYILLTLELLMKKVKVHIKDSST